METTSIINPEKLVDGHFVDLDTLRDYLDYLKQNGVTRVIIATGKWFNDRGKSAFGSPENGDGQYGYMLRIVSGFNNLEDDSAYIPGNRWLHCSDQLSLEGGHSVGSISDRDFEWGAIARIVTDPTEIEGLEFSYDRQGFNPSHSETAVQEMTLVAELEQYLR